MRKSSRWCISKLFAGLAILGVTFAVSPLCRAQAQGGVASAGDVAPTTEVAQSTTPAPAAQAAAAAPAAPRPLPTPTMTAPLATAVPYEFDAGPFGKIDVTGIVSGIGMATANYVPSDRSTRADLSNGQVFLQKTTGWFQWYLQAGVYNTPALATPFFTSTFTTNQLYGPVPVGYAKLVKKNFNLEIGQLPTLIGDEYTFTFENMNIERGLLWNQENAVSRGIQLSDSYKKLSGSIAWTDGFYSNRYTWLSGTVSYAINAANTLAFIGGGNLGQTNYVTFSTPVINNSQIYNVIYTYSHGNLTFSPYFQYTNVPTNASIGIVKGASTTGGAVLVNYNFKHGVSLAGRVEDIGSSGSVASNSINLIFGPGSGGFSFTATPTYQKNGFFIRGDLSVVKATSATPGFEFGPTFTDDTQTRGVVEMGFMF
jgi:hypothetical protein